MNKFAKIMSAVISVTVALSIAIVMLTSALAAVGAKFSMNLVEETESKVVIAVKLESGSFAALDFGITANSAKIAKCSKIDINVDIALAGGVQASNPETGLYGCAIDPAFETEGAVIATYTFDKVAGAEITKDDFALEVSNCSTDFEVVNNIPVAVAPTEASTEESTEASTEESTEASTEESTEESTEASTEESTEASTEESTEASTEESTEASTEEATEAPTEAPTQKPVDGEVVNPDTGDSVTATAAIFSLLAVSGAAIVALRKKED